MLKKYLILTILLIAHFFLVPRISLGKPLSISGWPTDVLLSKNPGPALSYDPILGRLLCPPALRLIPKTGQFDGLIIDVPKAPASNADALTWEYTIKSGLYWWDGSTFTLGDLAFFLEGQLAKIIFEKTEKSIAPKSFFVQRVNERKLRINWLKDPGVGPFIISGYPVFKKSTKAYGTDFSCVGTYYPNISPEKKLILKPVAAYGYNTPPIEIGSDLRPTDIQLLLAENDAKNPSKHCPNISLPYLTIIIPQNTKIIEHYAIRTFLKYTIPSKIQLQTVTQGFFEPLDSPFIDIKKEASDERNTVPTGVHKDGLLEYAHKHDLIRDKDNFLEISLASPGSPIPPALLKILSDNMASQGFLLKILEGHQEEKADLVLYTYNADYPEMNLIPFLSSLKKNFSLVVDEKGANRANFLAHKYLQQLSSGDLNLSILGNIAKIFSDQLVFLPIMQYKACIFSPGDKQLKSLNFDTDPDWIKRFLRGKT